MSRGWRLGGAVMGTILALSPLRVAADAGLSPPLDRILVPPPTGFFQFQPTGWPAGFFGLEWYAAAYGAQDSQAPRLLQDAGFIDGYGLEWIDASAQHVIVENVTAFTGHKGAQRWLSFARATDESDSSYLYPDAIDGLGDYYGEHYVFPSHNVLDSFIFIKGNDLFVVAVESTKDDVLSTAIHQSKAQFEAAPPATVTPSRWPENLAGGTGLRKALASLGTAASTAEAPGPTRDAVLVMLALSVSGAIALVAAAGVGSILLVRRRRRRPQADVSGR